MNFTFIQQKWLQPKAFRDINFHRKTWLKCRPSYRTRESCDNCHIHFLNQWRVLTFQCIFNSEDFISFFSFFSLRERMTEAWEGGRKSCGSQILIAKALSRCVLVLSSKDTISCISRSSSTAAYCQYADKGKGACSVIRPSILNLSDTAATVVKLLYLVLSYMKSYYINSTPCRVWY